MRPSLRGRFADLETPVTLFAKLAQGGEPAFLFESMEGGEIGRWSYIGAGPSQVVRCETDPWEPLRHLLSQAPPMGGSEPDWPPFLGGVVGFVGHEAVAFIEDLPWTASSWPNACWMTFHTLIAFDHLYHRLWLVSLEGDGPLDQLEAKLAQQHGLKPLTVSAKPREPFVSNVGESTYMANVDRAKHYIRIGDIFQVVLSQALSRPTLADPLTVYRHLRAANPSPYLFLLTTPDGSLVGSSPEVFIRLDQGTAMLRPIAGTRPRGKTPEEDAQLAADLMCDPKEVAEHVMLLDLGRNDLGRVCLPGSVRVARQMVIERYSHVQHIVSQVEGTLRPGLDAVDLMKAAFPAGTLSGAPKVRALQIIQELEGRPRGPYGGAVGLFGYDGSVNTGIIIRTAMLQDGQVTVQAGAGIVADSEPQKEWQETLHKAQALLKVLGEADA